MSATLDAASWLGVAAAAVHILIIVVFSVRVLLTRRAPASAAAWLLLVVVVPYAGALLYLLIGERPLSKRRAQRAQAMLPQVNRWVRTLAHRSCNAPSALPEHRPPSAAWRTAASAPRALAGSRRTLLKRAQEIPRAIITDIEAARQFCLLEFHI